MALGIYQMVNKLYSPLSIETNSDKYTIFASEIIEIYFDRLWDDKIGKACTDTNRYHIRRVNLHVQTSLSSIK